MGRASSIRAAASRAAWIGCALLLVAVVLLVAGCSASGNAVEPEPSRTPTSDPAPLPPLLAEGWWRTDLPADGDLLSLGAPTTGHVEVARDGLASIRITITGFSTVDGPDADLRVQLSPGDVMQRGHANVYLPDGDPVEVGTLAYGVTSAVIEFGNPQVLPLRIHSLVVLDYTTATQLAAAELVPGAPEPSPAPSPTP